MLWKLIQLVDIVDDGVTGLLVPPESPDALARALQTIATTDELTVRLGRGARETFERKFNATSTTERLLQIYQEAITAREASGQ